MKRVGYYVARMEAPHYGGASGDIGGVFKTEDDAFAFASTRIKDAPLGIYRVHSRRSRRDQVRVMHPDKLPAVGRVSTTAKSRHHATRRTPAQLEREIAEVLGVRPINKRKRIRHFSAWKDKTGTAHYAVIYNDLSSHAITSDELQRYRDREARGQVPR